MATKATDSLVSKLLDTIFTTSTLKEVSEVLEELSQDKRFKAHCNGIVSDYSLTDSQKKRQLSYLLKTIEIPVLHDFFSDQLGNDVLWLFASEKVDYFDKFVRQFQLATEEVEIIYLVTAIKLEGEELKNIAKDLTKSFGYKVILKHEVNPAIIGGAQIRVENMVFDYSLRTKFQQFQRTWIASLEKTGQLVGRNQST